MTQAQKKTFPELHIERVDLQLLNNKLQILYYQEIQKKLYIGETGAQWLGFCMPNETYGK